MKTVISISVGSLLLAFSLTGQETGQVRLDHQVSVQVSEEGQFDDEKCSLIAEKPDSPYPGKEKALQSIRSAIQKLDEGASEEDGGNTYDVFLHSGAFEECPGRLYIASIIRGEIGYSLVFKKQESTSELKFIPYKPQKTKEASADDDIHDGDADDGMAPNLSYGCVSPRGKNTKCAFYYSIENKEYWSCAKAQSVKVLNGQLVDFKVLGFLDLTEEDGDNACPLLKEKKKSSL